MFGFKKTAGDPAILLEALEKLAKVTTPGNLEWEGVDIGKVIHDALKQYKS